MADLIPNNGFNDEDVLLIPTGLDFSGINNDIKRMSKKLSSLEEDVTIDVDPEAMEALKEMQAQIEKLDKEMKNVKMNKISRGQFTKFEKEIREQVKSIEDRLNGLGDALVKVTEQFGKVGTDFDMSKVTEGFKEATEAVKGAITAVGELDQISKGGSSVIIDDSNIQRLEKALKGLNEAQKEYKEIDKGGDNYLGKSITKESPLEDLIARFRSEANIYLNWRKTYREAKQRFDNLDKDKVSADDYHIAEIEVNRAALRASNHATILTNLKNVIEELQKSSGIIAFDFDDEKSTAVMRSTVEILEQFKEKGRDAEEVLSRMNAEITKFNDSDEFGSRIALFDAYSDQSTELIKNLETVEKQFVKVEENADKANKQAQKTEKQIKAQSTLRDLLENKAIDIEVKTDTKQLEQELNAKVDALQEELRQKAIFVPIRVYVDSTNIKDAGNDVGEISPEVSSNKIENARKELVKTDKQIKQLAKSWAEIENVFKNIANESGEINLRKQKKEFAELLVLYEEYVKLGGTNDFSSLTANEKTLSKIQARLTEDLKQTLKENQNALEQTGEEAASVIMDLDKVTDKGLKSILKVVENAVNKFVNDTKNAIDKIFVDPFKVKIKLDEESTEGVKQNLSNDIVVSEADLSQNIKGANEAAKALVDTMKEILNLVEETGVASGSMITGYTKSGRKRSENKIIEDLVGKLSQYREGGRKIQAEIQDIFTKHPILLDLALKDGATDKVLKAIDESNFGYSLQRSLTHAQSIAESIVEVLKPLNGLEIKVGSTGKGTATGFANIREDLGQVFLKLNQIFDTLLKLHKYISGGNVKKTDDQLQQISVDFSEITEKIDTLIAAATALISTLTDEVSKINTSIETLDKNIDKAFDEKKIHAVSEEVKNIDLSSVNRNLAEIFKMLSNIFSYIQSINGALKVTDSFKLGNKWSEIEKSFKSIANASGDIDLRKQKKDVAELLKLYEEYVNLGGTNDFSMLTTNQKTLTKLQSQADKFIGGRNVVDNDKLRETKDVLRQIDDVLSSLTTSLSAINGLDNVAGVFKALNIKQDNIDKIKALPGQLKQINDELRELDNVPYSGFIAQLSRITEQAEGLKALAEILRSSPTQIQNAIDKTNGGKENEKAIKEQLKIATQLENQYKKLWNSGITEQSQPEKFADSLRAIEIILKDIHSIGEQKVVNDSDILTVKQLIDELKDWLVISEQIKYSTSELSNEFEKEAKAVKKYSDLFTKLYDDGAGEEGKSVEFIYYLHSIGALVEHINDLQLKPFHTEEDVNYIRQANQELEKYSNKLNQIIADEKELEKNNANDLSYKIREALKVSQSYERNFARSWGFGKIEENYTNDYSARLEQIKGILNEIQAIKDKGISTLTEADLDLIKSYNDNLEEEFKELVKINQISKGTTISNLQNKMAQYILKNTRLSEGMVSQLVGYIKELDNVDDITKVRLNEIAEGFNRVQYSAKLAGREGTGFLDAIRNKLKYGWAQSIAMFFSFYDIVRYIREISGTVTELNSKLIELAKVSNASIGDLYNNFSDFSDIAKETGGTISDIISATADWARNGYNLEESKELARASSIFQNIGDGLTANQSNEYLVSILKGFNLEASQVVEIMDKINNVSNNAASSVSNIGEALERSSSAFGAANTDLSQAVALLTTSNEVLQNPETVGTAFKSMSARLRSSTTELEEMGEEATLTTSKLRALVQGLTGVDIQKDENTFKSIYDILLEIGKEWKNLTDIEQASLSEALFGKRNSQVGFSILNNVERLEEIYALAEDSAGSAYEEQSKYLDGVQYKIDQFSASVESISNDILSSDFLKGAIGAGTSFVNLLDTIIKDLGAIPSLIGVISAAIGTKWNIFGSFIGGFGGSKTVLPLTQKTDLGALASGGNAGIKALIKEYNELGTTISQTGLTHQAFIAKVAEGNQDLATYFNKVGKDGKANFRQYTLSLAATTVATNVLKVATMALQGALFSIIGLGLSKVFEWVDGLITTSEEAIQKGEEARRKIEEINSSLKSQQKIVQDSGARFAELSQGINRLTGENISLSDEEYKEFLDISNQLVEVFPTLTHGYNDNGDAIVLLDGNVNTIIGSLNSLVEAEKALANQQILDAMPENFEGAIKASKEYDDEIKNLAGSLGAINLTVGDFSETIRNKNGEIGAWDIDELRNLESILNSLGIEFEELSNTTAVKIPIELLTDENLEDIYFAIHEVEDLEHRLDIKMKEKKGSISSSIAGGISAYLSNQFAYLELDDAVVQNGIERVFQNIDWTNLKISNWAGATALMDKVLEQVVLDADTESQFKMGFGLATQFNENEITWGDFQEKLQAFYNIINALDLTDTQKGEFIRSFNILFDIKTDKDNNPTNEAYNKVIGDITKSFEKKGKEVPVDIVNTIKGLYQNELDVLAKENINWDNILNSKDLDKTIQSIKDKAKELSVVPFEIKFEEKSIANATKGIQEIQKSYQSLFEKNKASKKGSDLAFLISDLNDLKTKLVDVNGQAIEWGNTWDDSTKILTDGQHSFEEMEDAMNTLLNYYVNATVDLSNFDKEQANALSTQLQLAGVTKESADAYVQSLIDVANGYETASEYGVDLNNVTAESILKLSEAGIVSEETAQKMLEYALKKKLVNDTPIKTSGDIQNLLDLAEAANITSTSLARLAKIKSSIGKLEVTIENAKKNGKSDEYIRNMQTILDGYVEDANELAKSAEKEIDKKLNGSNLNMDRSKAAESSSSKGGGGGSSKKEEDLWKKAYEEELKALDNLHARELISDIQYYEERSKLNDKYFGDYVNSYKKAINEMADYQQQGNVDLFNRPLIKGSELIVAGWQDEDNPIDPEEIATVYSSAFDILNSAGEKMIVHVTPILPDGTVMSPEQLEDYVYESLDGVNDVLAADTQGIVLKVDANVDVDEFGEVTEEAWKAADAWDVALHEVQEKVLLEGKDANEQAQKYDEEYMKNKEEIYKGFQSAYKSYVDNMTDYWKKSLDAGLINFSQYCDQMKGMLESLHNVGKIDDETYYTGLGNYYGTIVENYDKAINAAQRVIKKRIDALNKEKEAIEKNYEAQKDVLQAQIDDINDSIDGRNKQIKAINKQIDAINKEIESYQTEIDKLNEANEERQAALDMQKALYELSRAENQRKDYVYNSEQGFVYEANSQNIKNAQDEIAQLEHDRIVRDLEKTISTLENSIEVLEENIETLEDEIETLEGNIDSLEDEMEKLEKELDVLVKKYEEQIDSLEEYSDSIGECANKWTEAQEDMVAASIWGSDWQNKILSEDRELVQKFELMYVEAQRNQAQANRDATNAIIEANNRRIESLKELQKAEEDAKQASNVSTLGGNVNVSNKTTPKDTSTKKETPTSTKPVKYAWYDPSSKRVVYEYGSGTKDAKPGYQEIAETGDEIIVDNNGNAFLAKGHQLHLFEGGEQVYSPSDTKELLNGKYIPIDSILPNYSSMLSKVMSYSISPANNLMGNNVLSTKRNVTPMKVDSSIHIDIGDIHITEVDNVTEVAKAIKNQLPNALLQELNRK